MLHRKPRRLLQRPDRMAADTTALTGQPPKASAMFVRPLPQRNGIARLSPRISISISHRLSSRSHSLARNRGRLPARLARKTRSRKLPNAKPRCSCSRRLGRWRPMRVRKLASPMYSALHTLQDNRLRNIHRPPITTTWRACSPRRSPRLASMTWRMRLARVAASLSSRQQPWS